MTNTPVADLVANKITMTYHNYRGEVAARTITPLSIRWGVTDWHPTPGWLLTAFDHGKQADRDFALADCQFSALTPAPQSEGQQVWATDTACEALARAYDREDAAQRGEPDPWSIGVDDEPDWIADRIACAQAGLAALRALSGEKS